MWKGRKLEEWYHIFKNGEEIEEGWSFKEADDDSDFCEKTESNQFYIIHGSSSDYEEEEEDKEEDD